MNDKQIKPIIKKTEKALTPLYEIKPLKPKMKRVKSLKYDTSEKNWNKQIDDIIAGKMDTKENKKHEERGEKDR